MARKCQAGETLVVFQTRNIVSDIVQHVADKGTRFVNVSFLFAVDIEWLYSFSCVGMLGLKISVCKIARVIGIPCQLGSAGVRK